MLFFVLMLSACRKVDEPSTDMEKVGTHSGPLIERTEPESTESKIPPTVLPPGVVTDTSPKREDVIVPQPVMVTVPGVNYPGPAIDPSWEKHVYVITDSVVLGAKVAIGKNFDAIGWLSTIEGRPAMMITAGISKYIEKHKTLPQIVVVALGYNSIWEKNRKNFEKHAKKFDRDVEAMLAQLISRGVKKIVWVLLREPTPDLIPAKNKTANKQFKKYAWYFPYVNERLKALQEKHAEMALVDWPTVSMQIGLTYDAIHLNHKGAQTMTEEIMRTVGVEPPRQDALRGKKHM